MKKILVINGPNLNMLSIREPKFYGVKSLEEINKNIAKYAEQKGISCSFFQSNCEGDIVTACQSVLNEYDGCIINAGAYTHYSYAIADAIKLTNKPFIEVHLTNIHAREEFRSKSVLSPVCSGVICGFGDNSYILAIDAIKNLI